MLQFVRIHHAILLSSWHIDVFFAMPCCRHISAIYQPVLTVISTMNKTCFTVQFDHNLPYGHDCKMNSDMGISARSLIIQPIPKYVKYITKKHTRYPSRVNTIDRFRLTLSFTKCIFSFKLLNDCVGFSHLLQFIFLEHVTRDILGTISSSSSPVNVWFRMWYYIWRGSYCGGRNDGVAMVSLSHDSNWSLLAW